MELATEPVFSDQKAIPATPFIRQMEAGKSVCAVVVTYHPTPAMVENLRNVHAQTQALVVIDNGSTAEEVSALQAMSTILRFELILNATNLGIADALNQGVRYAKAEGYPWVILFDQDTKVPPGFVDQMLADWEAHPNRNRIGALHPRYIDPLTGIEPKVCRAADGGPVTSMTSGSLMPTWIFDRIGWFSSEFFIDQVDTEYGYRIRAAGLVNADASHAILPHSDGHPTPLKVFGFSFTPTNHNSQRRYYLTRNRIAVYRRYFWKFPRLVARAMYADSRETIKCFVAEEDRLRKFRNFLLGLWDGISCRMGRRERL